MRRLTRLVDNSIPIQSDMTYLWEATAINNCHTPFTSFWSPMANPSRISWNDNAMMTRRPRSAAPTHWSLSTTSMWWLCSIGAGRATGRGVESVSTRGGRCTILGVLKQVSLAFVSTTQLENKVNSYPNDRKWSWQQLAKDLIILFRKSHTWYCDCHRAGRRYDCWGMFHNNMRYLAFP